SLALVIILIGATNLKAKVECVAPMNVEPIIVEAQSQLTVDGKGFAIKRVATSLHAPTGGVERLAAIPLKIDKREGSALHDTGEVHAEFGVELEVELTEPTESGSHDQVAGESLGVSRDETGSQIRTELGP